MKIIIVLIFSYLLFLFSSGCDNVSDNSLTGNRITAAKGIEQINNLDNKPANATGGLLTIQSNDVDKNGKSKEWKYSFVGGVARFQTYFYFSSTSKSAVLDSVSLYNYYQESSPIFNFWNNSDEILGITENNGGREFRAKHINRFRSAQYKIEAQLIKIILPEKLFSPPHWYIKYYSTLDTTDLLSFKINAETEEIIN